MAVSPYPLTTSIPSNFHRDWLEPLSVAVMRTLQAGFIAPCLPMKTDKLPSGGQWLHEIKHDGFRVVARKDGAKVRLYSRPGNDLTYRFLLIVETVASAYPPNGSYDECGPTVEEHDRNVKIVRRIGRPHKHPIFGSDGPLLKTWKQKRKT
jgi:ATP dependent DNA ligase domain